MNKISKLLKELEFKKFAEELLQPIEENNLQEGQQIADKIFDKFLNELNIESLE